MKVMKKLFTAAATTAVLVSSVSGAFAEAPELVKLTKEKVDNMEAYKVELLSDKIDSMSISLEDSTYNLIVTSGTNVQKIKIGDDYKQYYFVRGNKDGILRADSVPQEGYDPIKLKTKDLNNLYIRENNLTLGDKDDEVTGAFLIEDLLNRGIVKGSSIKYNPEYEFYEVEAHLEDNITRAQFALILGRALELKPKGSNKFSDIKGNEEYAAYTTALHELGIITGYKNEFKPNDNITKEQSAVMLARTLRHLGIETKPTETTVIKDFYKISQYAKDDVHFLEEARIIYAEGDYFDPLKEATRGEVFHMLSNIITYADI